MSWLAIREQRYRRRIRALEARLAKHTTVGACAELIHEAETERDALQAEASKYAILIDALQDMVAELEAGKHRCSLADGTWMLNHACKEVARIAELEAMMEEVDEAFEKGGGRESGEALVRVPAPGQAAANLAARKARETEEG